MRISGGGCCKRRKTFRPVRHRVPSGNEKPLVSQARPAKQGVLEVSLAPRLGDDSSRDAMAETAISVVSGADSGAVNARDGGLKRLVELWPMLSVDDRAALLAHAEHLAALRDGATGENSSR